MAASSAIEYAEDVPSVLAHACEYWARVYRLENWDIVVEMTDSFEDDGEDEVTGAETTMNEVSRNATIRFRRDCTDDDLRLHAAHEFLHIAHGGVDHMVYTLIAFLPSRQQDIAREMYLHALERFVTDTTKDILRVAHQRDL